MNKKQKIISIVGTTATGKTNLALKIAEKIKNNYNGVEIISADSRQVYKEIEITSGADIPDGFQSDKSEKYKFPFFIDESHKIRIHGISIIKPTEDWSVSHFQDFARKIIAENWKSGNFVIIVGGAGLYHQHLFDFSSNFSIPPNPELRQKNKNLSVLKLQNLLKLLDSSRLNSMNNSDLNNPRRLIRAIEVSTFINENKSTGSKNIEDSDQKILTFGLTTDLQNLEQKIKLRVEKRLKQGSLQEIRNLIKKYPEISADVTSLPISSTLGFYEVKSLLDNKIDSNTCVEKWALEEFQYAKRQITWWKKRENVIWLEPDKSRLDIDRLLTQITLY